MKRAKKKKNREHWAEARSARNLCLIHVRRAKADFIQSELTNNKNDGRKFWQNIRQIVPGKQQKMNAFALNEDQNKEVPTKEIPDYIN